MSHFFLHLYNLDHSLSSGQNGEVDMEAEVRRGRSVVGGAAAALSGKGGGVKLLGLGAKSTMAMKF